MSKDKFPTISDGKKSKRKKIFYFVGIPLLVVIVAVLSYGGFLYNKAASVMDNSYQPIERENSKREEIPNVNVDDISMLILGVDDSNVRDFKEGSRTDAMILATFNQKQKSIKLLSIPRDTYVYIPEKERYTKINHAHSYGGVKLTIETVEELLDIPIDHYVKLNFNAFMEVVEAVGGVDVYVPYEIKELDSKDRLRKIHLKPGIQRLNGEEALAFVRTRKMDNDVERGKRQQEVITAILKKAMSISSITKYADIIEAVGDNMTTDIPFSEMKSFLDYAAAGPNLNVETSVLKGEDTYIDRTYYYQLDEDALEETKHTLKQHLGIVPDTNMTNSYTEDETLDSEIPANPIGNDFHQELR